VSMRSDRSPRLRCTVAAALLAALALSAAATASGAAPPQRWLRFRHVAGVVDLAGPGADGRLVVAAGARLFSLAPGYALHHAAPAYVAGSGEPYVALVAGARVPGAGCAFAAGDAYALDLDAGPSVVRVAADGTPSTLAALPGLGLLDGIAYDATGRFGHRLLVTATDAGRTTVVGLDCRGRVRVLTRTAPPLEGGIVVAPPTFGAFAGDLIAPDELSGRILAVAPDGHVRVVAESGLPSGADVGVESAGFVPDGIGSGWAAYLADRGTPGNPHPGTDSLLRLSASALARAGVRAGDLLVASEGGAATVAVRCTARCSVREVAHGPAVAHAEGHIVFAAR
jgi:hypothetical protein